MKRRIRIPTRAERAAALAFDEQWNDVNDFRYENEAILDASEAARWGAHPNYGHRDYDYYEPAYCDGACCDWSGRCPAPEQLFPPATIDLAELAVLVPLQLAADDRAMRGYYHDFGAIPTWVLPTRGVAVTCVCGAFNDLGVRLDAEPWTSRFCDGCGTPMAIRVRPDPDSYQRFLTDVYVPRSYVKGAGPDAFRELRVQREARGIAA